MEIEEAQARAGIINREAVRDGLYLGLLNVAISLIGWLVDPLFFLKQIASGFVLMAVLIIIQCIFLVNIRKTLGKYWSFGEALRASMIIAIVSTVIYTIWTFVLFNLLDHTLGSRMVEVIKEKTIEMMDSMGQGGQSDAVMEKLKHQDNDPGHIMNLIKSFLGSVAFWAVLSLILAAIFKKNRPVFTAAS